jgi:Zn-dependent peptidase ImmA (M78 family)
MSYSVRYIQTAETKSVQLLSEFETTTPPVPVIDIAFNLGLDVIPYDLGDDISGTLVIEKGIGFIGFNPSHSRKRQRFTIAHELGHFVLHYSENNLFFDKDFLVKYRNANTYSHKELIQEQEANAFAAALLMPKEFVLRELKSQTTKFMSEIELIENLAKLFDVSVPAMTYRLNNLNLID